MIPVTVSPVEANSETERRVEVTRGWAGGGSGSQCFHGYGVSVWGDEKGFKSRQNFGVAVSQHSEIINVLNATEMSNGNV